MLKRYVCLVLCAFSAVLARGQRSSNSAEYEFNIEGGVDLRNAYALEKETNIYRESANWPAIFPGAQQRVPAPYFGVSALRRLSGLRALWGLRADVHRGTLYGLDPYDDILGSMRMAIARANVTATVMLNYRAFIFDMQGDCDCPTWGDDSWFKKAFFVEFGVGGGLHHVPAKFSIEKNLNSFGFAYLARLGVSHRFTKQIDAYLAVGGQGLIADRDAFRQNDVALRPTLGITYRPRK